MGRTKTDYSKTQMYKLCCKNKEVKYIYVGHTTNWRNRKNRHKSVCVNNASTAKLYKTINDYGGWDNWEMVYIEDFPCENKRQAVKRERELYEELKANLNSIRPYITREEEALEKKARDKKYYEENKEQLNKRIRDKYRNDKIFREKVVARSNNHKEKHRKRINERRRELRLLRKIDTVFYSE